MSFADGAKMLGINNTMELDMCVEAYVGRGVYNAMRSIVGVNNKTLQNIYENEHTKCWLSAVFFPSIYEKKKQLAELFDTFGVVWEPWWNESVSLTRQADHKMRSADKRKSFHRFSKGTKRFKDMLIRDMSCYYRLDPTSGMPTLKTTLDESHHHIIEYQNMLYAEQTMAYYWCMREERNAHHLDALHLQYALDTPPIDAPSVHARNCSWDDIDDISGKSGCQYCNYLEAREHLLEIREKIYWDCFALTDKYSWQ